LPNAAKISKAKLRKLPQKLVRFKTRQKKKRLNEYSGILVPNDPEWVAPIGPE